MDMEAEMVYADILRTLQSSILHSNVSTSIQCSLVVLLLIRNIFKVTKAILSISLGDATAVNFNQL